MAQQTIKLSECIDYLVRRRFPNVGSLRVFPSIHPNMGSRPDNSRLKADVEAYRNELSSLTLTEINLRYQEEQRKEGDEIILRHAREEKERFFNQPTARADFEHWSKAAHWTLDEAIALSFGKAPEVVGWERLKGLTQIGSPFVTDYARRRDLALRAVPWKQLFDPVLPSIFLAWASRLDLSLPSELIAAIEKRGIQIADWKTEHDKLSQAFDDQSVALNLMRAAKDHQIATLQQTIDHLKSNEAVKPTEKSVGTRERESLLRLVIGMACGGYGYDPAVKRSDKIPDIASDLERFGVSLDADTIRKWLREAAELLPPREDGADS